MIGLRKRKADYFKNVEHYFDPLQIHHYFYKENLKDPSNPWCLCLIESSPLIINTWDSYGYTPLHHAVLRCNPECVKYLLYRGADPYIKSVGDEDAFDLACYPSFINEDVLEQLEKNADDPTTIINMLELAGAALILCTTSEDRISDIQRGKNLWSKAIDLRSKLNRPRPVSEGTDVDMLATTAGLEILVHLEHRLALYKEAIFTIFRLSRSMCWKYFTLAGLLMNYREGLEGDVSFILDSTKPEELAQACEAKHVDMLDKVLEHLCYENRMNNLSMTPDLRYGVILFLSRLSISWLQNWVETTNDSLLPNLNIFYNTLYLLKVWGKQNDETIVRLVRMILYLNPRSDEREDTLLHYACTQADIATEVIDILLDCGINVNATNAGGHTAIQLMHPFMIRAPENRSIVLKLVSHGAHIDIVNVAQRLGAPCVPVLDLVLESGAKPMEHVRLQCLCAKVLVRSAIPYRLLLPKQLYEFIDNHI